MTDERKEPGDLIDLLPVIAVIFAVIALIAYIGNEPVALEDLMEASA